MAISEAASAPLQNSHCPPHSHLVQMAPARRAPCLQGPASKKCSVFGCGERTSASTEVMIRRAQQYWKQASAATHGHG
jgi:hypothetical protein